MEAMEIAEDISAFFRSRITDENGNKARYVSVKDVSYDKNNLGNVIEYEINIHYLSDQGELHQPIIYREFISNDDMKNELDRYSDLENRCLTIRDIDLIPMIKINHENRSIIYEKIEGFGLDQLSLDPTIKDFIIGRICGVVHGDNYEQLDENSIRELLIFLLLHLPFTDEEKDSVATLLESHFAKFSQSNGGYKAYTVFIPENLIFEIKDPSKPVNIPSISKGEVLHTWMKLEIPDDLTNDRMTDVAQIYNNMAFVEFIQTGGVNKTISSIKDFMHGYMSVIHAFGLPSIKELYPNGLTLELQLILASWMDEAEKIQMTSSDQYFNKDLLRYTYYLLQYTPFKDKF